jgi:hypothetical protein
VVPEHWQLAAVECINDAEILLALQAEPAVDGHWVRRRNVTRELNPVVVSHRSSVA